LVPQKEEKRFNKMRKFLNRKCPGRQFHSEYSVLFQSKNTEVCLRVIVYIRLEKVKEDPRTYPLDSEDAGQGRVLSGDLSLYSNCLLN
jgi:hypothetical protein